MSFGSRLTHTVDIERAVVSGGETDYGADLVTPTILATVQAAIQPLSQQEAAAFSQAGAAVSTHRIYLFPTNITTADAVIHDPLTCPATADLPYSRFEVTGVPNAAGLGHHLEVEAVLVASPQEAEGS